LKLEFSATLSWLGEERNRMKASKFTEAQKAFILKQGEQGTPVAEICRKAGISQATYFNWKKKYGGLLPDEMRRLKALEDENARLKKIVADLTLDREMLQDVIRRSSEAWPDARTGSRDVHRLGRIDPRGLWGPSVRHLHVPLQIPPHRSGCRRKADQGDL
jgi:transposase-like protein